MGKSSDTITVEFNSWIMLFFLEGPKQDVYAFLESQRSGEEILDTDLAARIGRTPYPFQIICIPSDRSRVIFRS